eukprot:TRINITY_DN50423_c0_g1_i1.p1 TRINITY_DN50423_c0_g1~~TRINITY_DN50423_c0_g1_i1.p1  ORF type:complete len:1562 (+),score=470.48 TRINITY_DN50423_c0_g1_i1:78-4763(+)
MKVDAPAELASVHLYRAAWARRAGIVGVLVAIYAYTFQLARESSGGPYRAALREGCALDAKRHEQLGLTQDNIANSATATRLDWSDSVPARRSAGDEDRGDVEDSWAPGPSEHQEKGEMDEQMDELFKWLDDAEDDKDKPKAVPAERPRTPQRPRQARSGSRKRKRKSRAVQADDILVPRSVPLPWLPSVGALSLLYLAACLTAALCWLCAASPRARAALLYAPAERLGVATHALVLPHPDSGRAALARIRIAGEPGRRIFVFQQRRYQCVLPEVNSPRICVQAVMPETTAPLGHYVSSPPLKESAVPALRQLYGENQLRIPVPGSIRVWWQLMQQPITILQLLSIVLWLVDDYWMSSFFCLVMIMALEGVTMGQLHRNVGHLSHMGIETARVQAYRDHKWESRDTTELLPGDLISLSFLRPCYTPSPQPIPGLEPHLPPKAPTGRKGKQKDPAKNAKDADKDLEPQLPWEASDLVPCDCLLLRGSALVNESAVSGDGVPVAKEPVGRDTDLSSTLSLDGRHRGSVLFSGTCVIDVKQGDTGGPSAVPPTPDGGCLCRVLRTGYASSQGTQMQLLEFAPGGFSQEAWDTTLVLAALLGVAAICAGYTYYAGMRGGQRTAHEMLVKAALVLAGVVPKQVPFWVGVTVNQGLVQLMRCGVFCTQPSRMSLAGMVRSCYFDKTGTLTADILTPAGIVNPSGPRPAPDEAEQQDQTPRPLAPCCQAAPEAAMVLAGCHSLGWAEGQGIVGDPTELGAMHCAQWHYNAQKQVARPGVWEAKKRHLEKLRRELPVLAKCPEREKVVRQEVQELSEIVDQERRKAEKDRRAIHILHRHRFCRELRRMSTLAKVEGPPNTTGASRMCALVKGAPEALQPLISEPPPPPWYEPTYKQLTQEGYRVLALAYRWWDGGDPKRSSRAEVEQRLCFAGFLALRCRLRADTPDTVVALQDAGTFVGMITGDAPLTALRTAQEAGFAADDGQPHAILERSPGGRLHWVPATGPQGQGLPLKHGRQLAARSILVVTEDLLPCLDDPEYSQFWDVAPSVRVWARMSPEGKTEVIRALRSISLRTGRGRILACGDGSGDVGALSEADVGVALMNGFGNVNTVENPTVQRDGGSEKRINAVQAFILRRGQESHMVRKELLDQCKSDITAKQQEWLAAETKRLDPDGSKGLTAQMQAYNKVAFKISQEMTKGVLEVNKVGRLYPPSLDDVQAQVEEDNVHHYLARPGDASFAAHFTSRQPSIRAVPEIIRQGRCSLAALVQQQQAMIICSVLQALTTPILQGEEVRASERQVIGTGWAMSTATVAFAFSFPVETMHRAVPVTTPLSAVVLLSAIGQVTVHAIVMHAAVICAMTRMDGDEMSGVLQFHKQLRLAGLSPGGAREGDTDPFAAFYNIWQTPFKPNLLNTITFLVEQAQMASVLLVNYRGRPWMKGLLENTVLSMCLGYALLATFFLTAQCWPGLNSQLHMVPMDDDVQTVVSILIAVSIVLPLCWDRWVIYLLAPDVSEAMWGAVRRTRLSDFLPLCRAYWRLFGTWALLWSTTPPFLWVPCAMIYFFYRQGWW